MLFLLLGLVLLVDLAHSWAETCLANIIDSDSRTWRVILMGSTLGMYIGSLVLTIIMYIFFANSGCQMNQSKLLLHTYNAYSSFAHMFPSCNLDQPGLPHSCLGYLHPPDYPRIQPYCRACPIGYGRYLLHIPDHVGRFDGARRQAVQPAAARPGHA